MRAAILYSITANAKHAALKLTRDEKRASVTKLLKDEEWSQWSDSEIGRCAGVDHKTVTKIRDDLGIPKSDVRKGADGRIINTAKIGKLKADPPEAPPLATPQPEKPTADLSEYTQPRHLKTYSPPPLPHPDPEEAEPEIIAPESEEVESEPYIPPYVSNPDRPTFEIKKLSNEPKPKEPPFVEWYVLLGRVQSKGHRSLIEALNSIENRTQEQALEARVADVIEMLRASLKQAEIERATLTVQS